MAAAFLPSEVPSVLAGAAPKLTCPAWVACTAPCRHSAFCWRRWQCAWVSWVPAACAARPCILESCRRVGNLTAVSGRHSPFRHRRLHGHPWPPSGAQFQAGPAGLPACSCILRSGSGRWQPWRRCQPSGPIPATKRQRGKLTCLLAWASHPSNCRLARQTSSSQLGCQDPAGPGTRTPHTHPPIPTHSS